MEESGELKSLQRQVQQLAERNEKLSAEVVDLRGKQEKQTVSLGLHGLCFEVHQYKVHACIVCVC